MMDCLLRLLWFVWEHFRTLVNSWLLIISHGEFYAMVAFILNHPTKKELQVQKCPWSGSTLAFHHRQAFFCPPGTDSVVTLLKHTSVMCFVLLKQSSLWVLSDLCLCCQSPFHFWSATIGESGSSSFFRLPFIRADVYGEFIWRGWCQISHSFIQRVFESLLSTEYRTDTSTVITQDDISHTMNSEFKN